VVGGGSVVGGVPDQSEAVVQWWVEAAARADQSEAQGYPLGGGGGSSVVSGGSVVGGSIRRWFGSGWGAGSVGGGGSVVGGVAARLSVVVRWWVGVAARWWVARSGGGSVVGVRRIGRRRRVSVGVKAARLSGQFGGWRIGRAGGIVGGGGSVVWSWVQWSAVVVR
jgi:hypothetical protein